MIGSMVYRRDRFARYRFVRYRFVRKSTATK